MVAGQHAEPAGVDPEALVEAVLGAEVGDRALERRRVLAMEPVVAAVGEVGVEVGDHRLVLDQEVLVVEQGPPVDRPLQDGHRVAVAGPGRRVDPVEQDLRPGVPAPPQVVGQPAEPFELGRQSERRAGQRRNANEGIHPGRMIGERAGSRRVRGEGRGRGGSWALRATRRCHRQWRRCGSSRSPPNASRGRRPVASAMSSTRLPGASAGPVCSMARSTSSCRPTGRSSCPPISRSTSSAWPCPARTDRRAPDTPRGSAW